jgi:hypothetical protein
MRILPIVIITATILSVSCCREHITNIKTGKKQKVYFTGSIDLSKSTEIPDGSQSWIFIYNHGEDPCKEPPMHNTPVKAKSYSNGRIETSENEFIFVTPGCYDFYSLSLQNTSERLPQFTYGISDSLENDKDYLWSSSCNISISSDKVVNFLYRHTLANITIILEVLERHKTDSASISITLPNTNSRLILSEGEIRNHSIQRKSGNIILTKTLQFNSELFFLILPLADVPGISLTLNMEEKYTGFIPAPADGFRGGYRYTYSLFLTPDTLLIQGCTIEEWQKRQTINIITSEK